MRSGISAVKLVVLLLAGVVLAGYAWRSAAGQYYQSVSPGSAPSIVASANSAIALELADASDIEEGIEPLPAKQARSIAIAALGDAPLNSAAIRLLNGVTQFTPDTQFDRGNLLISEKVTRRDRKTELGLIGAEAQRGNAEGAMLHVDRLLTVHPQLIPQILPQLLGFLRVPELRDMIVAMEDRPWFTQFVNQAIPADPQPEYVAALISAMDPKNPNLEDIQFDRLAGQLAQTGRYSDALSVAKQTGVNTKALTAFAPNFENTAPDLVPLTWRLADQAEGSAVLADDGWVDVDMTSGQRLPIMQRVVNLSPGSHTLSTSFRDAGTLDGLWRWEMRCMSGGKWDNRWNSDWTRFSAGDKDNTLSVSGNCSVQELTFRAMLEGRGLDIYSVKVNLR